MLPFCARNESPIDFDDLSTSPNIYDYFPPRSKRLRIASLETTSSSTSLSMTSLLPEIPSSYLLASTVSDQRHKHQSVPSLSRIPASSSRPICKKLRGRDCHSDEESPSPSASPSSPALPFHMRATSSKTRMPPVCEKFLLRLKPKPRHPSGLVMCYSPPVHRESKRRSRPTPAYSDDETSGYSSGYDSFFCDSPTHDSL